MTFYHHRYCLRDDTLQSLKGRLAIINEGIVFAKSQIRKGCDLFVDLGRSMINLEDSDNDLDSDYDSDYNRESYEHLEQYSNDKNRL